MFCACCYFWHLRLPELLQKGLHTASEEDFVVGLAAFPRMDRNEETILHYLTLAYVVTKSLGMENWRWYVNGRSFLLQHLTF